MNNIPMRFKSFEFAINPQKIEIKAVSDLKEISVPFERFELQEFGINPLKITGSGNFIGEYAQRDFDTLYALFISGGEGDLFISGTQPLLAVMTRLSKTFEDVQNCISYDFEFVEVPQIKTELFYEKYHTVQEGDNLWYISCLYDVAIEKLFMLNKNIANAWAVTQGDRVRIQ
jgi:hypothetical protein